MKVVLVIALMAYTFAAPLDDNGEHFSLVSGTDEETVEAEINMAINKRMKGIGDLGESDTRELHQSNSAEDALAAIDRMSKTEMELVKKPAVDPLLAKFEADSMGMPGVAVEKNKSQNGKNGNSLIDMNAAANLAKKALADPKLAKELESTATNFFLNAEAVSLLQEEESQAEGNAAELGEDDSDDDFGVGIALTSGSDQDVETTINDAITEQMSNQMGKVPVDEQGTVSTDLLQKLEQDKDEATLNLGEYNDASVWIARDKYTTTSPKK